MGLNATVRKLLTRNPGSSAIDAARVRNSAQVSPTDVANSITSVQRQIDAVVTVALSDQTVSDPVTVSGQDGGQIGWIGTMVQDAVSYLGMWFQNFWLGGTSPATAQIYSDSAGDVFIDGAEIVNTLFELNLNGVTTSIENLNSAVGVLSIKSLNNSTLYYSGATPTGFELLDNLGNSLGYFRSSGGSGHLALANVAGTNSISLITGGGGSPKVSVTGVAGTVSMSPGIPLSVFGNTVVDSSLNGSLVSLTLSATGATAAVTQTSGNFTVTGAGNATFASVTASTGNVNITSGLLALNGTTRITNAGNASFAQVAIDLKAAAVTGTGGGTGVGNAMLSATTAGLFLSLNGAAPVALGPGGSNTQVQYNNSGAFGGSSNLTFNGTTLTAFAVAASALTVTTFGIGVTAGGITVTAGGITVLAGGVAVTGASSVTSASAGQTLDVGNTGGGNAIRATAGVLVTTGGISISAGGLSVVAGGFSVVGGIVANGHTGFTGTLAAAIAAGANVEYGIIY
tara:strand:+ start:1528 stop:3066 length:1539 start_codon:yes stop_codon:yes gene_type:complete